MSVARQCDGCGAVGYPPYDGWLRVESYAKQDDESADRARWRLAMVSGEPVVRFDVCGHECLPALALERAREFVKATAS